MNKINIDSTLQRFKKEDHRVGKLGRPCGEGLLLVAELDVDRHKSGEGEEKHQVAQLDGSRVPQLTCIWMSLPGASGLGNLT